jgi:hypothetical protein
MSKFNITGNLSIEIGVDGGDAIDSAFNVLPDFLQEVVKNVIPEGDYGELILNIRARGCYYPMSMYGGPDNLGWPEELDIEHEVEGAYILFNKQKTKLSDTLYPLLYEHFYDRITDIEFDRE